jgi:glutathione synthase/RimK-type ligase-like ATP-grasp enzyme
MILLWGLETDSPLAMVAQALQGRGAPVFFLDQMRLSDTWVALDPEDPRGGRLSDGESDLDLAAVTGVYLRPFDSRRLPALRDAPQKDPRLARAAAVDCALLGWCEVAAARVVNRPNAMASNNAKPYQCALIEAHGLATPPTLVTNDAEAARAFRALHGEVIYKSVSGTRSIVSRLAEGWEARIDRLAACPTQFQAYIPGVDVRAHVVGEAVFATEIVCDRDDYRYAGLSGGGAVMRAIDLEPDLDETLRRVTRGLGLAVSGIDLRRGPDGAWTCFEVNPSPGFTYFEQATGQPVAAAIADLLAG